VAGRTVAAALQEVFADNPVLRGYVLDDQGQLRQHVAIFVDGHQINDRTRLTDPVRAESEVFVVQALSGG
jgi:sulfur carrier protein ThiS